MKIKREFIALKYKSHNQNGEINYCPEELINLFKFDINIADNVLYYFQKGFLSSYFHLCLEHLDTIFSLFVSISVFFVVDRTWKKSSLDWGKKDNNRSSTWWLWLMQFFFISILKMENFYSLYLTRLVFFNIR
jgi:hypothetical protein